MRRVAASAAVIVGAGLIVSVFALQLFPRAQAGERLTDNFREAMSDQSLEALQTNFATIGAFTTQLGKEAMPSFQQRLGMSDAEFRRFVRSNAPAVAAGLKEIPPAAAFVGPVIPRIVDDQDEFESADELPALGLPISSVPWLMLGAGVALIAVGVAALRSSGRLPLVTIALLGAGIAAVPLIFSMPQKGNDAKELKDLGNVALSQQAADRAHVATVTIDHTVTDTQANLLPAVADRLGQSQDAFTASVIRDFPDVSAGIKAWPSVRPGAYELAAVQADSVDDQAEARDTPLGTLPWLIIVPGFVLLVVGALALWPRWSRPD
jgi:hypothetical protein